MHKIAQLLIENQSSIRFAPGRRCMKKNPIYIRKQWSLRLIRQFPHMQDWAPDPAWNLNWEEKSRCVQRAWEMSGFKHMFVCNLAVMRPSREVGNLKKEKHSPWPLTLREGKFSLRKAIHSTVHTPLLQDIGSGQGFCTLSRRQRWPNPPVAPIPWGVIPLC